MRPHPFRSLSFSLWCYLISCTANETQCSQSKECCSLPPATQFIRMPLHTTPAIRVRISARLPCCIHTMDARHPASISSAQNKRSLSGNGLGKWVIKINSPFLMFNVCLIISRFLFISLGKEAQMVAEERFRWKHRGAVGARTMVQRSAVIMSDKMMHQHDYAFRVVNSVFFGCRSVRLARAWET